MTTDKPEPMMSVEKAIVAIETIEVFHKTSDLCSEALPRVVDLIRSLDERARKAERNFEQAAACHKEALGWYNEANAQVAEQAKEIERLKKPKTCFWLDGKICCEERMHSGPDDYCHACGGKVVTGRSDD